MFVRVKNVGTYRYLQIAENRREGKRVKQTIIATLGRLDKLAASGAIDQLLRSAARFTDSLQTLNRSLWAWIEGEYHNTPHRGLEGRTPLEQWALAGAAVRYTVGVAGKIAQCVGVRLPNTVRQIDDEKESADQSL